VGVGRKNHPGS